MNTTQSKIPTKAAKQLKQLDADLTLLLEVLKDYSEATLNKKPAEDKWSVMQLMEHLMLVEGYGQSYVKKKLSFSSSLVKVGMATAWRNLVLNVFIKSPFKITAPDAVSEENLPEYSNFWETAKKWKEQRKLLWELFESIPLEHYDKEIYKHPLAGRLSIYGLLDFYQGHFTRHRKQMNGILKKSFKIKD